MRDLELTRAAQGHTGFPTAQDRPEAEVLHKGKALQICQPEEIQGYDLLRRRLPFHRKSAPPLLVLQTPLRVWSTSARENGPCCRSPARCARTRNVLRAKGRGKWHIIDGFSTTRGGRKSYALDSGESCYEKLNIRPTPRRQKPSMKVAMKICISLMNRLGMRGRDVIQPFGTCSLYWIPLTGRSYTNLRFYPHSTRKMNSTRYFYITLVRALIINVKLSKVTKKSKSKGIDMA